MEPLSIALGVSGLVPLFKVCTQLFDLVDSSRTRGTDFEVLSTMLEIERVRLCIWGQAVGFVTDDQSALDTNFPTELDDRLKDRRISAAVSDVLACMKRIFEDSYSLKQQYGLQKAGDATNSPESRRESGRTAFRTTFKRTLERFNSASASNQRNTALKASAKWVIVDKKRFRTLVEDLRGFNDSLSALLPDIDSFARQEIVADIGESVDADELRLIEQAAVMGSHYDFSEAVSVRLSQISQVTHRDNGNESVSTASTLPQPVDVEKLVKQIGKLEAQLRAQNKGMLDVSINETYGNYWGFVTWDEVKGDEWYMAIEKELEFVKPSYLAWGLQYATDNEKIKEAGSSGFERLDPEAGRNYHGKFPGTKTVEGYASEFQHWADQHIPKDPETCFVSTHPAPSLGVKELIERINIIQGSRKLPWGWMDKQKFEDLQKWIGKTNETWIDQSYKYSMVNQVDTLLSMLNRVDMFEDLRVGGSIGYHLFGPKSHGLANFLLQMILAYELKLRLENYEGWNSGMTPKVFTALEMAQRWMESVKSVCPNEDKDLVEFHSLAHERQVEGLVRSAEAIEWPKLFEMREFAEEAYVKIRAGSDVPLIFWNWLFGLVLPGDGFVYNLMGALIFATPSLRSMGEAKYMAASVVIDGKSY
ncbi:hypothetical protein C7212DRAFT_287205 [Tuber magnatum]|uniref:Prion-inhibition and propagation HeLo domain-containing protein n=1 Tax=Tuber magnatum TaxID=42249 RepID=A0A317SC45_9PEZI|nr:hypothetical protein C7212DRAFT_287205 [Tuber magnatum]